MEKLFGLATQPASWHVYAYIIQQCTMRYVIQDVICIDDLICICDVYMHCVL